MHHGKRFLVGMLLSLFVVGALFAQGTSISGFGGIGMPMSPAFLKDNYKSGLAFGANLRYNLNERTALSIGYQNQTLKSDFGDDFLMTIAGDEIDLEDLEDLEDLGFSLDDLNMELSGLDAKANIITANLVHYLTPPSTGSGLYVTGGAGLYMMKVTDPEIKISFMGISQSETVELDIETKNKMGINAGLGFEMLFGGNMFLFVEGKYHYIFTDAMDLMGIDEVEDEEMLDALGIDDSKLSFISIVGGLRIPLN